MLKEADILIRECVKNISCLPTETPNSMLYSPRKYRGLGIVQAHLQRIYNTLTSLND